MVRVSIAQGLAGHGMNFWFYPTCDKNPLRVLSKGAHLF